MWYCNIFYMFVCNMLAALKSSSSNSHSNSQNYAIFIFCSLNKNEETKRKKNWNWNTERDCTFLGASTKQTDTGRHKDRLTNEMNKYTKNKQTNKQTYIQQLKLTDEVYNKFMAHSVVIQSVHNSQTKRTTS